MYLTPNDHKGLKTFYNHKKAEIYGIKMYFALFFLTHQDFSLFRSYNKEKC